MGNSNEIAEYDQNFELPIFQRHKIMGLSMEDNSTCLQVALVANRRGTYIATMSPILFGVG